MESINRWMAPFLLRHGRGKLPVRIVPKDNALPFLVEEAIEGRVDLIDVTHASLTFNN